jgi:hypothetical protein
MIVHFLGRSFSDNQLVLARQACISFHGTYRRASRTVELFTYGMKLGTVIPSAALSTAKEEGRTCLLVGGGWQGGIAPSLFRLSEVEQSKCGDSCQPPLIPREVSLCVVKTY